MNTCPLLESVCQNPAGLCWGHAAAAGEGLLPGLPLPVPFLLPAPEAAGLGSAGCHEQGPHLGKGQETHSEKCCYLEDGSGSVLLHNFTTQPYRANPSK